MNRVENGNLTRFPLSNNEDALERARFMVYDKEVHELWWEYLKRSKNFRIFCDVLAEYPDPEMAFLRKMSILPFVPDLLPSSPEKIIFNELLLWMNYKKFGDVFRTNFDDWWKSKQSDNSDKIVEDLEETIEREACFFVGYCAKVFKVADLNDENIIELLHKYIRIQNDYKFVKIRISAKDLEMRNAVSRIISKSKKKRTPHLAKFEKYLRTFDLILQGKSDKEIGIEIFFTDRDEKILNFHRKEPEKSEPMTEKELSETIREYKNHAECLITNAEQFNFPGEY